MFLQHENGQTSLYIRTCTCLWVGSFIHLKRRGCDSLSESSSTQPSMHYIYTFILKIKMWPTSVQNVLCMTIAKKKKKKLHYTKIVHLRHLTLVCENKAFSSQQFWNSKHLEHRLFELRTFDRTNIFHDRGWILILKCNTHYWSCFSAGTFHFAGMKSIYSFRITVTFVM